MRKITLTTAALKDLDYFKANQPKLVERIKQLVADCAMTPTSGIGKPEPLRYALTGYWSRRINREHRLVYTFTDDELIIIALRYHYK